MILQRLRFQNFILVAFFFLSLVHPAAASCGDIVTEYDYGDGNGLIEEREPIVNCANPFNADNPAPFGYQLTIAGQAVDNGSVIKVIENEPVEVTFSIDSDVPTAFTGLTLFHREGDDYRPMSQFFDGPEGLLPEGEYVAVLSFELPPVLMAEDSFWKRLVNTLFLPQVAYAYYPDFIEVVAVSFTVEYETPPPTGASSVLFLPGIMGSRLYEAENVCDEDDSEAELWFSMSKCVHERLKTDFLGNSTYSLYTKPDQNSIVDETLTFNLYKTFLLELADWKEEDLIADYKAVPYDWRLSLENILKSKLVDGKIIYDLSASYKDSYLYQALTDLVESSKSGKVTIVTHSNGGLLAKYLIRVLEIENDPLLSKIDNLVLVGVPQVGTPESLVGVLHGSAIGPLGWVLSQSTSRYLMGNMAFSHHLLPHADYFSSVSTPAISFVAGSETNAWIEEYGSTIDTKDELKDFMSKSSGRVAPEKEDLDTPAVVDGYLFTYQNRIADILSAFEPPDSMKVYQIAGTGLLTPSHIKYFTDRKCISRNPWALFICTAYEPKLGYLVEHTIDGDETVVTPSALAMGDSDKVERWWLDLLKYNKSDFDPIFSNTHKDIFEIDELIDFIKDISSDSIDSYRYISDSEPVFIEGERLVFQLHSPLDLSLVDSEGNTVSSTTVDIEGAVYRRYGELQYISIPADVFLPTIVLVGEAFGSFTLDIEKWLGDTKVETTNFSGIPSSEETIVLMSIVEDFNNFELQIDYNGDGNFEGVYKTAGNFVPTEVETEAPVVTVEKPYRTSSSQTRVLDRVQVKSGVVAGVSTSSVSLSAEHARLFQMVELLTELVRLLKLVNNK